MSKPKHTPGPWKLDNKNDNRFWVIRDDGAGTMKMVAQADITGESNENAANARLIAAAPELLEALEKAHDLILSIGEIKGGLNQSHDFRGKLLDLISKARGES